MYGQCEDNTEQREGLSCRRCKIVSSENRVTNNQQVLLPSKERVSFAFIDAFMVSTEIISVQTPESYTEQRGGQLHACRRCLW
jgi:hypothetical protein